MFQAVLYGKVRNNFGSVGVGSEWRSLYRQTEDFLTAAVFCRLTYLPSKTLWSIIRHAARLTMPSNSLPKDAGQLRIREFWPRWELAASGEVIGSKEPDVFLGFELLHLLVEAKLGDDHLQQNPSQWAAEIAAYLQSQEGDHSVPFWLLAIGGMGREPMVGAAMPQWQQTEHLLRNMYRYPNVSVLLATCSWQHLLMALVEEMKQMDTQSDSTLAYIISDLIEILRFHGIRYTHWLPELLRPNVLALRTASEGSLAILGVWARRTKTMALAVRSPWFIAPGLRGLCEQSILTFGRICYAHTPRN